MFMKMLVSDFDGTLYTNDYQKNIEAVNRFVEAGNLFVINTSEAHDWRRRRVRGEKALSKNRKTNSKIIKPA